jgi:hypothetical protein
VATTKAPASKPTRTSAKAKPDREKPYWIGTGEKLCADCGGTHTHAVETHCIDCDVPLCPVCAEHEAGEIFCSVCDPKRRPVSWQPAQSGKA